MACFVASNEFNELNVGFSLDEGFNFEALKNLFVE